MSSGRALEVQYLEWTSFWLQPHFHKCALDLHLIHTSFPLPKRLRSVLEVTHFKCTSNRKEVYLKQSRRKGNISKVKCRSSVHFPPIWDTNTDRPVLILNCSLIIIEYNMYMTISFALPFNGELCMTQQKGPVHAASYLFLVQDSF